MWTAELSGNTVAMIRDDRRLRYDRSTPERVREKGRRREREGGRDELGREKVCKSV